jgi:hypothetical protein
MSEEEKHVIVTDIRMSFFSMVVFMVKWVIASIPALFILGFLAICVAMISRILIP